LYRGEEPAKYEWRRSRDLGDVVWNGQRFVVLLSRFAIVGLALAVPLAACTVGVTAESGAAPVPTLNVPDGGAPDAVAPPQPIADGSTDGVAASPVRGSPLCNASDTICFPDYGWACAANADGGATVPGDASGARACRVTGTPNTPPQASCGSAAGTGGDGAPCTRAADCSAGFECVGAGQCRHYCCDDKSCNGQTPDQFFCDIQPTVDVSAVSVPVCMPVAQCKLEVHPAPAADGGGPCPQGQQCSIVSTDGTTSCVAIGVAQLGDSCDTDHCAEGLVCLGMVASRVCWQLCSTNYPYCPGTLRCHIGGPIVPDPTIGICDK
jgi:hypothetical protein